MFKVLITTGNMQLTVFKSRINAVVFISALYFIIWSVLVVLFPSILSSVVIDNSATPLLFWDLMGLITLVLGIGLLIASFNPLRHWTLILIATLFHLCMISGFIYGYYTGFFNSLFLQFVFFNHLIWLFPNLYILYLAYKRNYVTDELLIHSFDASAFPLEMFDTTTGENLGEITTDHKVLLVFLRHFGCPFCKESLMHLAEHKQQFEEKGIKLVLVYMIDAKTASGYLDAYGLAGCLQVSDPEEIFYKRFQLRRGNFTQLFGWKVWVRWIELGFRKKLFNTRPEGDVAQMPGIFLLEDGRIIRQFVYRSVADVPDLSLFLRNQD